MGTDIGVDRRIGIDPGCGISRNLDNGSPFVDAWLLRGCAVLGIRLIHSRPGKPEGRGKIERFFRTVRDQFLVEVGDGDGIGGPGGDEPAVPGLGRGLLPPGGPLRDRRGAHRPLGRAAPAERAVPDPGRLREAFLWSERRRATKTALVSLHGNSYQVDAWLAGKYVELVFDPFDLDRIEVRLAGKPAGTAVPFTVGRHRHPKTRTPDGGQRAEPAPTGIDYLAALGDSHDAGLKEQVSYRSLIGRRAAGKRREGRRP